jgi:hypothetical protein
MERHCVMLDETMHTNRRPGKLLNGLRLHAEVESYTVDVKVGNQLAKHIVQGHAETGARSPRWS